MQHGTSVYESVICVSLDVWVCASVDEWMKKMSMDTTESYLVFKKMGTVLAVKVHAVIQHSESRSRRSWV